MEADIFPAKRQNDDRHTPDRAVIWADELDMGMDMPKVLAKLLKAGLKIDGFEKAHLQTVETGQSVVDDGLPLR